MLFVCLPAEQYAMHTNTAYPARVPNPGDIPNYEGVTDPGEKAMIWHRFCILRKYYMDTQTMDSSLIDRFLTLLQSTYTDEYKLIRTGDCKQTFQVCFNWFLTKYAHNNEIDRTANKEAMTKQWNPADGFERLVAQLTKGLIFALYAGAGIIDVDVVDMGIGLILQTGLFAEEYARWYRRPANKKTFANFKIVWAEECRIKKSKTVTAGQHGYGMNTIEEEVDEEYDNALNNMSQAHLAQQTAISNMSNNNTKMDAIQQQLNSMTQMFQQQMNFAARQPLPMYAMPYQQQPFQQQQQPFQQQAQYQGGNGQYKKKRNRRGGSNGGQQGGQPSYGGGQQGGQQNFGGGSTNNFSSGGGNNLKQDSHREVKSHEADMYCSTHRCDCSHNGSQCSNTMPGHNPQATRLNPMGGNPRNSHRKYLPSTIGKPTNWRVIEQCQKKNAMTNQQYGGNAQQQQNNGFGAQQSFGSGYAGQNNGFGNGNFGNGNFSNGNFGNGNFGNQQGFGNNF